MKKLVSQVTRNINHYLLWWSTSIMQIILFVELAAGSRLYMILFGTVGFAFDFTKDRIWRSSLKVKGHKVGVRWLFKIIALFFACFSMTATGLAGLTVAEKFAPDLVVIDRTNEIEELQNSIERNRQDIEAMQTAKDDLESTWVTSRIKYQDSINALTAQNIELGNRINALKVQDQTLSGVPASRRMFDIVARKFEVKTSLVVFIFFLFMGIGLELGTFASSPEMNTPVEKLKSAVQPEPVAMPQKAVPPSRRQDARITPIVPLRYPAQKAPGLFD